MGLAAGAPGCWGTDTSNSQRSRAELQAMATGAIVPVAPAPLWNPLTNLADALRTGRFAFAKLKAHGFAIVG